MSTTVLACIFPLASDAVSSATRPVGLHGKTTTEEFMGGSQAGRAGIVEWKTYKRGAEGEVGSAQWG